MVKSFWFYSIFKITGLWNKKAWTKMGKFSSLCMLIRPCSGVSNNGHNDTTLSITDSTPGFKRWYGDDATGSNIAKPSALFQYATFFLKSLFPIFSSFYNSFFFISLINTFEIWHQKHGLNTPFCWIKMPIGNNIAKPSARFR